MDPTTPDDMRRSYDLGDLDADAEMTRLAKQMAAVVELEGRFLDPLNIPLDGTIVDLGCGPGFVAASLARRVPDGRIVCVDADPKMVALAAHHLSARGITGADCIEAQAHRVPLDDHTADLVHARFLLQHLADPVGVLREARRLGRPGTAVVVGDTDDGAFIVHPEPPGFSKLIAASQRAQAGRGGDRHVGRKLRAHLLAAGLVDVTVDVVPITSEMLGMVGFVDLALGFKRQIVPADDMAPDEVARILDDLYALADDHSAFAQTLGYVGIGMIPDET